MIHMYNKADVISRHVSNNSDKSSQRKNVILMGDSLGDLDMAAGVKEELMMGFFESINQSYEALIRCC